MEFTVLGWPPDGPKLRLDYREFSYAGKFVMTNTGKAVALSDGTTGSNQSQPNSDRSDPDQSDPDQSNPLDPLDPSAVLAAAAFNEDRTDPETLWIRYVTVRADRRGAGIGPRLAAFVADRADERGYRRLRIAVNNPFAYHALYKAGFTATGDRTGLAELVLERDLGRDGGTSLDRSRAQYQNGLDAFRDRELSDAEAAFLREKADTDPPSPVTDDR